MSKLSPKKEAELYHKLSVLASLTLETLDELSDSNKDFPNYKEAAKKIEGYSEAILQSVYGIEELKTNTYIQDLANKIDTVIRKNAVFIKK